MAKTYNIKYELTTIPLYGKTYSLFSDSDTTKDYFKHVNNTLDSMLTEFGSNEVLLNILFKSHKKPSILKNYDILNEFKKYTIATKEHLKSITIFQYLKDKRLRISEHLQHLYMLETSLMNRMNKEKFLICNYKLALLPHCLHDLSRECKSKINGIEYTCSHCSKKCYVAAITDILEEHNIHPYIWREMSLKKQLKILFKKYGSVGVLGIACIPELGAGMWRCTKYGVPVVGVPLNANRCLRWYGEFRENNVDLDVLRELVNN